MNIYQILYDLLVTYVYGGSIVVGSYQELVAILFSTIGCLFVVALPFIIVYMVIRFLTRGI